MEKVKLVKSQRRNTCLLVLFILWALRAVNVGLIGAIGESNPQAVTTFALWEFGILGLFALLVFVIGMMYFYQKWSEKRDLSSYPLLGIRFLGEKVSMICGLLTVFMGMFVVVGIMLGGNPNAGNTAFLPAIVLTFFIFWILDSNFANIETE